MLRAAASVPAITTTRMTSSTMADGRPKTESVDFSERS
jgi:hypothetical protein